ncbi:MAG: CHASE3 domain-containing protein, partial [Chthoniobacteraceae bacterium]
MIKATVGMKIGAGFALAILILVVSGLVSYFGIRGIVEATNQRKEARQLLLNLHEFTADLAEAELSQRDYLLSGKEASLDPFETARQHVKTKFQRLRELTANRPEWDGRIDGLEEQVMDRFQVLQRIIDLSKTDGWNSALEALRVTGADHALAGIQDTIDRIVNDQKKTLAAYSAAAERQFDTTEAMNLFVIPIAALLLAAAAFFITRNIAIPLRELTTVAGDIAAGNLTGSIATSDRADEVGALARRFGNMSQSLRGVVREIMEAVSVMAASASQISASTTQLAASASESASAVAETTTTVEEVRQTAQISQRKAQQVSAESQKAAQIARDGKLAVDQAVGGMTSIREQMDAVAESIL